MTNQPTPISPEVQHRSTSFLLSLAQSGVNWDVMREAILLLQDGGRYDPLASVVPHEGKQRVPMPMVLLHYEQGAHFRMDERFVSDWINWGGKDILTQQFVSDKGGKMSAVDLLLSGMNKDERWHGLEHWIKALGWGEFSNWVAPVDRNDTVAQPLVVKLLNAGLAHRRNGYNHSRDPLAALEVAIAEGADITGTFPDGMPWAKLISSPAQWSAYIAQGGDPNISFKRSDDDAHKVVLWQHLTQFSIEDTKEAVKAWVQSHQGDDSDLFDRQTYWTQLHERMRYGGTLDMVKKVLRAHPKWHELVDENGLTPMMAVIGKHPSAHNEFKAKKISSRLGLRDNEGRSLWFHALKGRLFDRDKMNFLLSIQGASSPSVVTGRGLLSQLCHDNVRLDKLADTRFGNKLAQMKAEDWLGMPENEIPKVVDFYLHANACNSSVALSMALLVDNYSPYITHPHMQGMMCLMSILAAKKNHTFGFGADNGLELIKNGATLPQMSVEAEDSWRKELGEETWAKLKASMQKNVLLDAVGTQHEMGIARKM